MRSRWLRNAVVLGVLFFSGVLGQFDAEPALGFSDAINFFDIPAEILDEPTGFAAAPSTTTIGKTQLKLVLSNDYWDKYRCDLVKATTCSSTLKQLISPHRGLFIYQFSTAYSSQPTMAHVTALHTYFLIFHSSHASQRRSESATGTEL